MTRYFDFGSLFVIVITFVLFIAALFIKGWSHDLLLEVGVFLVSVKLIMMGYKSSKTAIETREDLDRILAQLEKINKKLP
jgi:hypothetical protein